MEKHLHNAETKKSISKDPFVKQLFFFVLKGDFFNVILGLFNPFNLSCFR